MLLLYDGDFREMRHMEGFYYLPVGSAALRGGCYLTSIGSLRYKEGQSYPVANHPPEFDFNWSTGRTVADFALVFVVEGGGVWETRDSGTAPISTGDALFILPGQWHRYRPNSSTGWVEKWICLRGHVVRGFVKAGLLPNSSQVIRGGVKQEMEDRIERLLKDVASQPQKNLPSWGARALAILLECCGDPAEAGTGAREIMSPSLAKAAQFIEDNCHRPLRLAEVANACGLGLRTLERRFASAGLGSVGGYIITQRVQRAQILLQQTGMTIKEISYTCGFGNPGRMIYDFRAICGTTPAKWRAERLKLI